MADFYPITGIQDGLDPKIDAPLRKVHLRLEIDEWYQSQQIVHINQRALFFPAFWTFSQMSPKERLSYFQIAGIHGLPFVSWDEPPQKGETAGEGYCTHNSILFATWHRPYLMLWEQAIYELMKKEFNKYKELGIDQVPDLPELEEALHSWRFPYWDWALKKPTPENKNIRDYTVPEVFYTEKVTVRQPPPLNVADVSNAFYKFTMPEGMTFGDARLKSEDEDPLKNLQVSDLKDQEDGKEFIYPYSKVTTTSRHSTGKSTANTWIEGAQNNGEIVQALRDYPKNVSPGEEEVLRDGNLTASLRDAFYRTTTIKSFKEIATTRTGEGFQRKSYSFDSAEGIHNNLHNWCGGPADIDWSTKTAVQGHMSNVPVAAFDPIFWLHHCNIDRLIAIWQIKNPESWFEDNDKRNIDPGTFAIKRYHQAKAADNLRPFHNKTGNYWTSDEARHVAYCGYTYSGLEKWMYTKSDGSYDGERHIKALNVRLNQDYNSARSAAEKSELTADPGQEGPRLMSMAALQVEAKKAPIDLIGIDDYVINLIYEKFALGGAGYSIHFFIGKVPSQTPYVYDNLSTQVGEVVNFSAEPRNLGITPTGCENCEAQLNDHTQSSGRLILSNALITRWKNQVDHEPEGDGPRILESMRPEHVVKFLKHNLHWRVTSNGLPVHLTSMPSLKISLGVGKADHFADLTKESHFYEYRGAFEVTQGRLGGAGPEHGLYPPGFEYTVPS
ncbi:Di-copper centre-containing protein [Amniculicola lignicola CBS 123094]|uniref:tyrosinase n=1 Tax=Amniculicola lignicola CBS 123094 TaxID=1392246 RepID=A0A6A5WT48_9PLEO|nr:Di-copper centre-containing protein [Amniculicola lignicola CBS 123094]